METEKKTKRNPLTILIVVLALIVLAEGIFLLANRKNAAPADPVAASGAPADNQNGSPADGQPSDDASGAPDNGAGSAGGDKNDADPNASAAPDTSDRDPPGEPGQGIRRSGRSALKLYEISLHRNACIRAGRRARRRADAEVSARAVHHERRQRGNDPRRAGCGS